MGTVKKILKNAMILTGSEMEVIDRGYIAIEDGKITEIETGSPPPNESACIDMAGGLVVPGLINAHIHIGDSIAKEVGAGRSLYDVVQPPSGLKHTILRETPPEKLIAAMKDTLQDLVKGGITTFADFREGGPEGVRCLKAASEGSGIRVLALGRPSFQFQDEALRANVGGLSLEAMDEVRMLKGQADGLGLSSPNDYTDQALQQLSNIFKGRKLIATHVAEHQGAIDTSIERTGLDDFERSFRYLRADFIVHLTKAGGKIIRRVSDADVPVVCCPRANAALGLGFPPIRRLMERGVTVALGSDNVMVNSPDLFREMEFTARFLRAEARDPKFPTPLEIFKMVTINAARALGLGEVLGSIERGKLADLVVIDTEAANLRPIHDPISTLVHRVRPENVKTVLVEGEIVYSRA